MGRPLTAAVAACAVLALAACAGPRPIEADVRVRDVDVPVYVADDDDERSDGLQGIELAEAGGMLFLWPSAGSRAFAIKDVGYALDVIWISPDGTVISVSGLAPGGPELVESPGVVGAVLEVPAGFAEEHGVAAGDPVTVRRR